MSKKANRITLLLIATFLLLLFSNSLIIAGPNKDTQVGKTPSTSSNYALGSEIRISKEEDPEPQRSYTQVAYNDKKDEYLVVWSNEWLGGHKDIYARRVESDGNLLNQFTVASGANDKYDPAVVFNSTAEEYLVVWLYTPPGGGNTNEVWGRLVSWDGATLGTEFQIASWPNRQFADPSVAWNSNLDEYLVVWGASDATAGWNLDVSSMLIAANGDIITGRNLTTSNQPFDPDVVYNPVTNEYFVVYTTFTMTSQQDIMGLRVKANNSVIDPPGEISIVANNVGEMEPSVATNGKFNYATVWQSWIDSDYDIYGQRLDFNGNKPWNWDSYALTSHVDESHPDIAYDGQDSYLITWQRFDSPIFTVRAQSRDFAAGTYEYFNIASDALLPVVAAGSTQFLVAYQGKYPNTASDYRHIFGRFMLATNEPCTDLVSLTVTGPTAGQTGSSYTFQVNNIAPLNVTFPILYSWSPTPANQSGNSATYSWSTEGVKTITATGSNCAGSGLASDDHTIIISAAGSSMKIYLPLTIMTK
jgi:hypothetical protein